MSLIIERWIFCDECNKRWKPEDQSINEEDKVIHMCNNFAVSLTSEGSKE